MSTLKINNLSKKFHSNNFYSLKNANLGINDGDIVNGAGKSILLKLIAKSYISTSGTIVFCNQKV